ncbi:MAG: hypothetical protein FWF46_09560 [Oscillospiraceae bacterium]|nr:hypothetical protein [Oscillospiraceae bacterium]
MKILISLFFIFILFYSRNAVCCPKDYNPKSDDLKLEMYNTTLLISDLSEEGGKVVCLKMKNKEWSVKFPDSSEGAVNAGFFTDRMDYIYVTWVSPDGHISYNIFETATGHVIADIHTGRNMPSIIWPKNNKLPLPLVCVNNKGIRNYSSNERRETDGIYKYYSKNNEFNRISYSTKACSSL